MQLKRLLVTFFLLVSAGKAIAQDVDLLLTNQYLAGKPIVKLSRDFDDPYMWILGQNNAVYRMHTVSRQIDDYTTPLQALGNYQIVDIAGMGPNWVVLLMKNTDGSVLVSYNNGTFSYPLQDAFYQPNGNINSIGAASFYTEGAYLVSDRPALIIGAEGGFYRYSFPSGVLTYSSSKRSQIYSANYRTQLFGDNDEVDTSGVNLLPVMGTMAESYFSYYPGVVPMSIFPGNTVNTAYICSNQVYSAPLYFTPDVFWGNASGLYQTKVKNTPSFYHWYKHYLDNIKVNKICDIFGLVAFGNQKAKENLLVGTDNGLYYSSSVLRIGQDTSLDNFTLYHFDKLGNVPINFIEVNNSGISFPPPYCEDGIWVATNNGVYLIKPDYTAYLNPGKLVNAAHFINQDITKTTMQICAGDATTIQLNPDITANTIQWFKDGQEILNQNGTSLQVSAAGDYYAILFDPCAGLHAETNHLTVQVIAAPVFSFNYPDKVQYCGIPLTTLQTDNNPAYQYRWYTNGVLNGVTTYNYTVTQSGKYKVEVSACTNTWIPSKEIEVDLINLPVPALTADKTKYCAGDNAILTVNIPTDPSYTINWYKDGNIINADQDKTNMTATEDGNYSVTLSSTISTCIQPSNSQQIDFTPAPVFTFNYPDKLAYCSGTPVSLIVTGSGTYQYRWYTDGVLDGNTSSNETITKSGKYKVEVSACEGSWVPSKEVEVDLISIPVPAIKTDKPTYCIGDNATMNLSLPTDPRYTINWYKDNAIITSNANLTSLTTNIAGDYSVTITSNEVNTDGTACTQTSAVQNVTFNPLPTLSIQQIIKTTLCDGQTIDLKVTYNSGTVKWSNGQNTDQITVGTSGTYTATVTSAAGCNNDASINVQFLPNPVLNLPNAGVCVQSHKIATITAPADMTSYVWNGRAGTPTYTVDHPQTVTLTVTDGNGCSATQDVQVVDECPDIAIPNAFTPNGDGINDTWDIKGLEYDQSAVVKIYTRNGQQVFESRGYAKAWDGTYKGKQMPSGAYYYIITAKNNAQTYSGSVTIIY